MLRAPRVSTFHAGGTHYSQGEHDCAIGEEGILATPLSL